VSHLPITASSGRARANANAIPEARTFTFGRYRVDRAASRVTFEYHVDLRDGTRVTYKDELVMPGASTLMWARVPEALLEAILRPLGLALGIVYWKLHCAPQIVTESFALSPGEAAFWQEVYTVGLAEFFFLEGIDFRGLVSFPSSASAAAPAPVRFPRSEAALSLLGGGKDSIVAAELLQRAGIPFDLFAFSPARAQLDVADVMMRPVVVARRTRDAASRKLYAMRAGAQPSIITVKFTALLAALLHDYRWVVTANELSADEGNTQYLGIEVNHQWSKSAAAEEMFGRYVANYITPDVQVFSVLRHLSELAIVRDFVTMPRYLHSFASCNTNYQGRVDKTRERAGRAYWCNVCPKCAFLFVSLAAFLPKPQVVEIFGADLLANPALVPTFRQLLGLEGFKPFECVGTAEETAVAMYRAWLTKAYAGEPGMAAFEPLRVRLAAELDAMQARVLSPQRPSVALPPRFEKLDSLTP
jgi:hypothetical protein